MFGDGGLEVKKDAAFYDLEVHHEGERPLSSLLLWQVSERASVSLQVLQLRPDLTSQARDEPVAHLTRKHQLVAFIVADDRASSGLSGVYRRLRAPAPC